MNVINHKKYVKKSIMFIKGEDFYFLAYNILVLLDVLNCIEDKRVFRDYRKLSYLIDFISDYKLNQIIRYYSTANKQLNPYDHELLTRAYSNALIRKNQILKLLHFLEKRKLVMLVRDKRNSTLNLYLKKDFREKKFLNSELFDSEKQNSILLKNLIPRLSSLKFDTLQNTLFEIYGIKTWEI